VLGVLFGGPIGTAGHLACTIKVGVNTHLGAYFGGAERDVRTTSAPTVLPPRVVSFVAPPDTPVYLCDQFDDWVYDDRDGTWVPAGTPGATCRLAPAAGTHEPALDPLFDLMEVLDSVTDPMDPVVLDPLVCPILASLAGDYAGVVTINSQGDVFLLGEPSSDCPPYDLDPAGPPGSDVEVVVVPPAVAAVGST
jgi:hypothetical protein